MRVYFTFYKLSNFDVGSLCLMDLIESWGEGKPLYLLYPRKKGVKEGENGWGIIYDELSVLVEIATVDTSIPINPPKPKKEGQLKKKSPSGNISEAVDRPSVAICSRDHPINLCKVNTPGRNQYVILA